MCIWSFFSTTYLHILKISKIILPFKQVLYSLHVWLSVWLVLWNLYFAYIFWGSTWLHFCWVQTINAYLTSIYFYLNVRYCDYFIWNFIITSMLYWNSKLNWAFPPIFKSEHFNQVVLCCHVVIDAEINFLFSTVISNIFTPHTVRLLFVCCSVNKCTRMTAVCLKISIKFI